MLNNVLTIAHHIRNRKSDLFNAACSLASKYRWCLTGTPIHNSLDDYGALLAFINVTPLTEKSIFNFWITSPLKENRPNSLRRLQQLIRATCLRRTKQSIKDILKLPPRIEKLEILEFTENDRELYNFFKDKTAKIAAGTHLPGSTLGKIGQQRGSSILSLMNFLRLICNHGEQLLPSNALSAWNSRDNDFLSLEMSRNNNQKCDNCDTDLEDSETSEYYCRHVICLECSFKCEESSATEKSACPKCFATCNDDVQSSLSTSAKLFQSPSAKLDALLKNLRTEQIRRPNSDGTPIKRCVTIKASLLYSSNGYVSVVFSYWTKMLDIVQQFLQSEGFVVQRIDGQKSLDQRRTALTQFNDDPSCTVMLASIGSAGEG
jgi:SNF2 family DNA or RNA helicase